jgi:hypothetical protein
LSNAATSSAFFSLSSAILSAKAAGSSLPPRVAQLSSAIANAVIAASFFCSDSISYK